MWCRPVRVSVRCVTDCAPRRGWFPTCWRRRVASCCDPCSLVCLAKVQVCQLAWKNRQGPSAQLDQLSQVCFRASDHNVLEGSMKVTPMSGDLRGPFRWQRRMFHGADAGFMLWVHGRRSDAWLVPRESCCQWRVWHLPRFQAVPDWLLHTPGRGILFPDTGRIPSVHASSKLGWSTSPLRLPTALTWALALPRSSTCKPTQPHSPQPTRAAHARSISPAAPLPPSAPPSSRPLQASTPSRAPPSCTSKPCPRTCWR